jgi:hypothetical protein
MKPTDEKPLIKPLDQNEIEVLAVKPGHGSSSVVLIDGENSGRDSIFIGKDDWMADIHPMVLGFINAGDQIKIFSPGDAPIDGSSVVFTDGELIHTIEGEVVRKNQLNTDAEKAAFNKELDDAMNEWIKNPTDPVAFEKVQNLTSTLPGAINDPNQVKPMAMVETLKKMMAKYPEFEATELEHGLPTKGTFRSVDVAAGTLAVDGIKGLDDLITVALTAPPQAVLRFTLEEWIAVRQQVSEGIDPVMLDFLRANADQFDPMRAEGDGVTLRSVGMANAALIKANNGHKAFPAGSVWVAPKLILESLLTPKMADDLIQLAKDKGLEVDTFVGKKLKFENEHENKSQTFETRFF